MCLMVYLGTDTPVPGFDPVPAGAIGLDPGVRQPPRSLAGKAHVAQICDRVPTGWNCSCIFLDDVMPWEAEKGDDPDDPDTPRRAAAYEGLRRIARAALAADPRALIFSCWSGDEARAPAVTREMAPEKLQPARYLFDDILDGGSGANPPVLIRLTEETPHVH